MTTLSSISAGTNWEATGIEAIRLARRVNRTWIVRGNLADTTERYMNYLAAERPEELVAVCEQAVREAKAASRALEDPKPAFYASIFSRATREERDHYLRDHFFTRFLSAEMQIQHLQAQQ